jgi:hypothetical protein
MELFTSSLKIAVDQLKMFDLSQKLEIAEKIMINILYRLKKKSLSGGNTFIRVN